MSEVVRFTNRSPSALFLCLSVAMLAPGSLERNVFGGAL
jgi:hypothetical protein